MSAIFRWCGPLIRGCVAKLGGVCTMIVACGLLAAEKKARKVALSLSKLAQFSNVDAAIVTPQPDCVNRTAADLLII